MTLRLGAKAHLVHYPLRDGAIVNLVAVIESGWRAKKGDDPWDGEADRASLERAFAALGARGARADRRGAANGAPGRSMIARHRRLLRRGASR